MYPCSCAYIALHKGVVSGEIFNDNNVYDNLNTTCTNHTHQVHTAAGSEIPIPNHRMDGAETPMNHGINLEVGSFCPIIYEGIFTSKRWLLGISSTINSNPLPLNRFATRPLNNLPTVPPFSTVRWLKHLENFLGKMGPPSYNLQKRIRF